MIFGDNDGDGDIDADDVTDFLMYDAWLDSTFDYTSEMNVANVYAMDLDYDGDVDIDDMLVVLAYDAWLLDEIPQTGASI